MGSIAWYPLEQLLLGSINYLAAVKRFYLFFLLKEDKGAEVHPVFLK